MTGVLAASLSAGTGAAYELTDIANFVGGVGLTRYLALWHIAPKGHLTAARVYGPCSA
jgi:hypothetical protein